MQRKSVATVAITVVVLGAAAVGLASTAQASDTAPANRGWDTSLNRGWEIQPHDSPPATGD
ncbi:hypothetical protein [Pseudonocardia sp. GCM10023141]|uniref:hypothetical protein n=1 Tax=Pseudonocardia sp. GCM10023141 TaxID=3252653 RepID=UPI00361DE358